MTRVAIMFDPSFIADGETPAKFDVVTFLQGGGILGVLGAVLGYASKRGESKDTTRDKADDRANVIEGKRMEIQATERERLLTIFREDKERAIKAEGEIRQEMLQTRRTFTHELRNIQQHLLNMGEFYHQLHTAATMLAMQARIMRARLKKNAEKNGEKFDEDEFPVVDITLFDPKTLPKFASLIDSEEAKITGRVEILMPKPMDMDALKSQHSDFNHEN